MMRMNAVVVLCVLAASVRAQPLVLDVCADLVREGVFERNASGDGQADDSPAIQAAIDFVAQSGGGTVFVPAGTYRIADITVPAGVTLSGAGPGKTVFRALGTAKMLLPTGGTLRNFTAFGTPTADVSGDNWQITTRPGSGGTATCSHIIAVQGGVDVRLENVEAYESRYDCLYVAGSRGLRVINCRFNRAGRNIVSLVGNDEDFLFEGCRFGSIWRLYHFDIEPNEGRYVRDGLFLNCSFDGRDAGKFGSDTWGRMLILTGHDALKSRDITIAGCVFREISVRVRGIFPGVRVINNPVLDGYGPFFLKVRTNPVGELRDAVIVGNNFVDGDQPAEVLRSGVTFTGETVLADNTPEAFNNLPLDEPATTGEAGENRVAD